jgi:hypothetical protein
MFSLLAVLLLSLLLPWRREEKEMILMGCWFVGYECACILVVGQVVAAGFCTSSIIMYVPFFVFSCLFW